MSREVCGICWCPYDEETGECACEPEPKKQHMTTLREAAQQALETLEWYAECSMVVEPAAAAMTALRAALAEPVQEPVAWIHTDPDMPRVKFLEWRENEPGYRGDWIKTPLYAAPPQRPAEPVQEPVANDDEVICPACCHQFRAIPPNVQQMMLDAGFEPPFTTPPQRPAEPVQEPVAYSVGRTLHWHEGKGVNDAQLYLAPPQRKPLTEEEIDSIWDSEKAFADIYAIARAIERAHGIGGQP